MEKNQSYNNPKNVPINYQKYPQNWKTEIRPTILKRANNKCEFCGFHNGQIVYRARVNKKMKWFANKEDVYKQGLPKEIADFWTTIPVKVVLTIAHLDHDETNPNPNLDRLKALCQLCHLQYDAKEKYRRRTQHLNKK